MNEYLAVISTLSGVLVGGLVNFLSTRTAKRHEWRLTLARDQLIRREQVYADFLAEARRLAADAIFRDLEVPRDVHQLDRFLAQMSLLSPEGVINAARDLRRHLVRNRSGEISADDSPPTLNQLSTRFTEAARTDLNSIRDDA
jgi:hypothetical protein